MKKNRIIRVVIHVIAFIIWYLIFSFSLFLGLQISPMLGNIGVIISLALIVLYIFLVIRISKK